MTAIRPDPADGGADTPFLGLAPFLRLSIAGADLRPIAADLLERARRAPEDAGLWMNLSIAMQCLGLGADALAVQARALALRRRHRLPAARQPARLRLLVLMTPGDLDANTPLDCLLEGGDIDLDLCYLAPTESLTGPLPPHDALLVAIADAPGRRRWLAALDRALEHWPRPVINRPDKIPNTDRAAASRLLAGIPGLLAPPTQVIGRDRLRRAAAERTLAYPVILRPSGSQAGRDLARIDDAAALAGYLARVAAPDFCVAPFVDYRAADGTFRKCRVALVDGEPFACHLAISSHWMVHYVNAGMYEDAGKRATEARFMAEFAAFARRHRQALQGIHQAIGLDYVCIDCAELPDGRLLLFEVDHAMVVHAMDPPALFPYRQAPIHAIREALRALLLRRIHSHACSHSDSMEQARCMAPGH